MRYFSSKWTSQYPDLGLISSILEDTFSRTRAETCSEDGKWRPLSLLLGAVYRAQQADREGLILAL